MADLGMTGGRIFTALSAAGTGGAHESALRSNGAGRVPRNPGSATHGA